MPKKIKAKVGLAEKPQVVEIEVPDQELPVWDLDAKLSVVGKRVPRVEGPEKVTGEAKYTLDYTPKDLPGLLYGKILWSPFPHARVERIDASKAQALPGIKAILLFDKGEGFNTRSDIGGNGGRTNFCTCEPRGDFRRRGDCGGGRRVRADCRRCLAPDRSEIPAAPARG